MSRTARTAAIAVLTALAAVAAIITVKAGSVAELRRIASELRSAPADSKEV